MGGSGMTEHERVALAREIARATSLDTVGHACGCTPAPQGPGPTVGSHGSGFSSLLDQSLTRPSASESEVEHFLIASRSVGFHSVIVQPTWAALAVRMLRGRNTRVASLVGFPHGSALTPAKCMEAEVLLRLGVQELEMVANIGALRSGDLDAAFIDIQAVAHVAKCRGASLKVVLELPLLTEQQKIEGCAVARLAGADCVVTASGSNGSRAEPADVKLMKRIWGELDVAAAGGIRTLTDVRRMLDAGATRIGTSHGLEILKSASA